MACLMYDLIMDTHELLPLHVMLQVVSVNIVDDGVNLGKLSEFDDWLFLLTLSPSSTLINLCMMPSNKDEPLLLTFRMKFAGKT